MFTYRYTGDLPTAFITLRKNDQTWFPSKGDTIDSEVPIRHFQLELVTEVAQSAIKEVDASSVKTPAGPDKEQSPVEAADESKEN